MGQRASEPGFTHAGLAAYNQVQPFAQSPAAAQLQAQGFVQATRAAS